MGKLKWWILLFWLAAPPAHATTGAVAETSNVKARLVSETSSIGPGQSIWVALEMEIRDGWHTYWRNPGDSGQATSLSWKLPAGFVAGDINWPAPHRFELPPLVNYGYAKHAVHMVRITAPSDLQFGRTITLQAKASWLVCSDVCIPEDADLQLTLPSAGGTANAPNDPATEPLFTEARSNLPTPEPAATSARVENGHLIITLGKAWGATLSQISSMEFFPYAEGEIDYAAPQVLTRSKDMMELAVKAGYQPPQTGLIRGVLLASEQTGGAALTVPIEIAARLTTPATAHTVDAAPALPSLLLLAILGGLVLNLMPCVFPVLSIKAIGLVEQAKKHPAAVRAKGLVFAAGVISSMLALAAVLLALRAGGEQIGWGFQLQSPLFVTLMIYLLLGVGLNLSGVFEFGGSLAGVGDSLTQGESYRASFFTGVLTTLVATPCTAPFMAAAVGAALTQSPITAIIIFFSLGLGLSLPYLLLSFAPWMRRALPKPGAWMDTLKQIFAFPMYASAAWLLWVLAQQTSSLGLGAALAGAVLIALAAWTYQRTKSGSGGGRMTALAAAVACVILALLLPVRYTRVADATMGGIAGQHDGWLPYDASRAAETTAAGKPLLINFTASWCLTCLVNERNAFADPAVQQTFRDKGVVLMKGDWTNRDPAITEALAGFGRAGVPLYVLYNAKPGSAQPLILPQLLTANIVHDALLDSPRRDLK